MTTLSASLASAFPGLAGVMTPVLGALALAVLAGLLLSCLPSLFKAYSHYCGTCSTLSRSTYARRCEVAQVPTTMGRR